METHNLTAKIMPKMPKIACNWSSWVNVLEHAFDPITVLSMNSLSVHLAKTFPLGSDPVQNLAAHPTKRDQVVFSVVTKGAAPSDW